MSNIKNYPEPPYYDTYDPDKDYVQVLAKSGNYSQAREFSEIGDITRDFMGRLGDSIFINGHVISGCELVIKDKIATVQPGKAYVDGLVRIIREPLTCEIKGEGEEVLGFKIVETLVTAAEDESLRNPASGTEGYNSEGASRVKQTVELTVDDADSAAVYKLKDGSLQTEVTVSEDETQKTITNILAKRTYDVSGNFKVEGLDITDKDTSDNESQIYVGAGSAYIHGYNVKLENMQTVDIVIPEEFRACHNEPKTYRSVSDKFYFNNQPAKRVLQVTSKVQIVREITRGSISGGSDELPDQPVDSIVSVVQGGTTYVQGTDFQLIGNSVDWSLFGREPSTGSTYEVTYRYMRDNIEGEDFVVGGSGTEQYIQFLSTGALPMTSSQILIDYEFYLSRIDTICIDSNSEISVIQGISDRYDLCEVPLNQDTAKLVLGSVLSYANSTRKMINNSETRRLTQNELFNMKRRLDDVEFNQAQKDLDDEAEAGEDATTLKGIFTDGFVGYTKADLGHEEFDCSIDVDMQELTVPFSSGVVTLNVDEDATGSGAGTIGRIVTAPYRNVIALSQNRATTRFLVNPYAVYNNMGLLGLSPAVDNWIDRDVITIRGTNTASYSLRRWWYHRGESWAEAERQKWIRLTGITGEQLGWSNYSGVSTSATQTVKSESIAYMRKKVITVTGSNFEPGEDNIRCYFNGNRITITNPSISGASTNTVKANEKGRFSFRITVPDKTPCGSVEVKTEGPITTATNTYTAEGTKVTTTNKVLTTRVIVNTNDPLAQSFQFDEDTVLTGIDLFFAAKDISRSVVVQVRDMINGYPGTTCFTQEMLAPEQITVNGDRPVATHINFSQPVYCMANTQYCFAILSDSNVYQLWQATMGELDVVSRQTVSTQPLVSGVMFSSSNNLTWTAHQTSDLTFNLYKSEYVGDGEIIFENVSQLDFDRILLAAEVEDHKNAGITWLYKINSSSVWSPIDTYVDRDTDEVGNAISLKAIIKVAQSTSPIIANDCINLVYFKNKNKGTYVSRQVEFSEDFTSIKVDVQFALPTGCVARVYYMLPDVSEDWVQLTSPTVVQNSSEFDEYIYTKENIRAKKYRVKVELETVNPLLRPRARKLMSILKY